MTAGGVTADEAAAAIMAALGGCRHEFAIPVELAMTGEVVAAICPDCGIRLPVSWLDA